MTKFFFSFLISCFIFTIISCGQSTDENLNYAISKMQYKYEASEAKIKEVEALIDAEKLKIDEKKLLKNLSATKISGAKAKKESELSSLNYFKSEKDRFKKLFKNKTITKSKLEKTESDYNKSFFKV